MEKQILRPFLQVVRDELIEQLGRNGYGLQDIADIFSVGITKSRVHQILNKNKVPKGQKVE